MTGESQSPRWAPKVPQALISRLYAADAQGISDPDLIDEVGWALWERCDSILVVTAAHYGKVKCPSCGTVIECQHDWSAEEQVICPSCDWQIPWITYHQSYRSKQLFGANATEHFEAYHETFPREQSAKGKMLLIDQLIHAFHITLTDIGRPAAANLIQGTLKQVIEFLNALTSGDLSAAGLGDSRAEWLHTLKAAPWSEIFLKPMEKE